MADGDNPLPFTIKPLPPPPPTSPPVQPPKGGKKSSKPAPPPATPATVRAAARFRTPAGVLSFVGFVAASRLATQADCRRSPDGAHWWAAVEVAWDRVAEMAWAAGGRPFAWQGGWVPVPPGGEPTPGPTGPIPADPPDWPEAGLADLLGGVPLVAGPVVTAEACAVVAPGPLARWVVRRALAAGLTGTFRAVRAAPLGGGGPASGRVLIRLTSATGVVPAAMASAVARLPAVAVATPASGHGGRVLVDARCRSPLPGIDLDPFIPTNEAWLLAAPDVGHARLLADGPEADLADLIRPPAAVPSPIDLPNGTFPPSPVAVRLVREPGRPRRADAVLVDDAQLEWLRRFLPGRASAEVGFLLPGPGRHLLTGPGGLPDEVPFGVPLVRVGPGGLYVESGCGFDPQLPPAARREAYQVGAGRTVAVTRDGAFAFDPANLTPAWVLWLGPPAEVRGGVSAAGRAALVGMAESIRKAERERAEATARQPDRPPPTDRGELLKEATRRELAGELVEAAGLLERAGEYLRAARLYERAAGGA